MLARQTVWRWTRVERHPGLLRSGQDDPSSLGSTPTSLSGDAGVIDMSRMGTTLVALRCVMPPPPPPRGLVRLRYPFESLKGRREYSCRGIGRGYQLSWITLPLWLLTIYCYLIFSYGRREYSDSFSIGRVPSISWNSRRWIPNTYAIPVLAHPYAYVYFWGLVTSLPPPRIGHLWSCLDFLQTSP